jgi:menaquinone-9 beta-reductase
VHVTRSLPDATDIFVVGGGPAGLAAAIAARQRGFRVVVADGAHPPIDKACGEAFLPDGVAALARLGIPIPAEQTWGLRGIRFCSGERRVEAKFPEPSYGQAIRRISLHRIMIEHAEKLGAELLWGAVVTGISGQGVRLGKSFVRARWIIGADGANSRVRQWAGLDRSRPRMRYAFRQHFRVAPWTDLIEVYWDAACQGYATGVGNDQVCVALASRNPNLRLAEGLRSLPALQVRLRGADIISTERGALTGNRQFARVCNGHVALIGDASGTVDAITGEGLGLSFSQALLLAERLRSGDLRGYERANRRLALRPKWMARLMLTMDRRPRLQSHTLRIFERHPRIFQRLVEFHVGILPPSQLVRQGLTLGWDLLTT